MSCSSFHHRYDTLEKERKGHLGHILERRQPKSEMEDKRMGVAAVLKERSSKPQDEIEATRRKAIKKEAQRKEKTQHNKTEGNTKKGVRRDHTAFSPHALPHIPQYQGVPIYEYAIDSSKEKPWLDPGADLSDYFNYGFNEATWRAYAGKQARVRESLPALAAEAMLNPPTGSAKAGGPSGKGP